jgi:protein deglycase
MKVLLFCARGFETMEFSVFIDVMGWARNDYDYNIEVDTCGFSKQVISTFNVPIIVDKIIEEIDTAEYDALAIPGGFEEYNFYEEAFDERLLKLIREFDNAKKPIATICVAALALGKSGILKGRKATTYHLKEGYRQKQLAEFGADVITNQSIVVDDNVITSYCPETAAHVAFTLLEKLTDSDRMKIVKQAMGY